MTAKGRATYIVHTPGDVPGEPFVSTKHRAKLLIKIHGGAYRWLGRTCHVYLRPGVTARLDAVRTTL